ncbi:uncharacterized protein [Anabrus simplex]|uniref:uncharacterized protein n=1 Tax=Anabrus simplex TaxID=316456 RepID=UPI0034DD0B0C
MIIGNIHDEFTIVAARERLCAHAKNLGPACHGSLLPAVYRAALAHSAGQHQRRQVADHSQDAILYVTVVIVFYAAIILLLVGTNLRRRHNRPRNPPPPPPQIVIYDQKRGKVEQKISTGGGLNSFAVGDATNV